MSIVLKPETTRVEALKHLGEVFREAGIETGQHTETVLSSLYLQERLCHAIDQPDIAQGTVKVQGIERQSAIGVEGAVLKAQGDIELTGGQNIVVHQLLLKVINRDTEAAHSRPYVVVGDVQSVVVVPHRRRTFGKVRLPVQHRN